MQNLLHPWTSYVIVPIFALANAGVVLNGDILGDALGSAVTIGVVLGLVVGKFVGISVASLAAERIGSIPPSMTRMQLSGGAALAGIGFTVSLFITDLAFEDPVLRDQAKVGVLIASLVAALIATVLFRVAARREGTGARDSDRPTRLDRPVDPQIDHIRGPAGAPLTLLEFGDYECPFCTQATGVVEELQARFGDDLRYVYRHLPLPDKHPGAHLAAEAAEAAGVQGRFWEMHERLFAHEGAIDLDTVIDAAQALDLELGRFVDDLQEGAHVEHVRLDGASASGSGVRGTPTFFVGDHRHEGPWDAETLAAALEASRPRGA
jgi:protein-disulfide isomerase